MFAKGNLKEVIEVFNLEFLNKINITYSRSVYRQLAIQSHILFYVSKILKDRKLHVRNHDAQLVVQ